MFGERKNKRRKAMAPNTPTLTRAQVAELLEAHVGSGDPLYTVWKWDRHTSGLCARVIGVERLEGGLLALVIDHLP